ncbi:hypothetical protein [Micromonospora sp. RTP1Z1]|uniref:hypothetical protein n=1 Tax=Micromonospora sp. RTP1Z1 TaxID=2994043 RepID=UPI0029C78E73|nr:hypothetical protein [Micromonospora sp. RTP1Z1]
MIAENHVLHEDSRYEDSRWLAHPIGSGEDLCTMLVELPLMIDLTSSALGGPI